MPKPDEAIVRDKVSRLLESQRLGVLSTQGEAGPYSSLVAFIHSRDLRHIYFATSRTTRKFANLARVPRIAMLIDSRANQSLDFHSAQAVTVIGEAAPLDREAAGRLRADYIERHPYLKDFVNATSCALVEIRVARYIQVERFQNVVEYVIENN
jgi:nitroimidazol reductase NimA-like FMN-containing flavoprotein (pyridoxamine 5'-phosphate oxidase superfamily)